MTSINSHTDAARSAGVWQPSSFSKEELQAIINDDCLKDVHSCIVASDNHVSRSVPGNVHRNDLRTIGYDVSKVSDGLLNVIASKVEDNHDRRVFLINLSAIADQMRIPKICAK